jgi:RNA polymerase sigma-70 factor, ECF subfamily
LKQVWDSWRGLQSRSWKDKKIPSLLYFFLFYQIVFVSLHQFFKFFGLINLYFMKVVPPLKKDSASIEPEEKQEQFMLLYTPVHARLARFVHSMVWHHEDARDIIAETVLKAYEKFEDIEHPEAFLYFLFGIASRLSKRRGRRLKIWASYDNEYAENIIDNSMDASRKLEVEALYKTMKRLPEKQREAISLFHISGFTLLEIQKIQGGSLSGVKSRITRGREMLTRLLIAEYGDSFSQKVSQASVQMGLAKSQQTNLNSQTVFVIS